MNARINIIHHQARILKQDNRLNGNKLSLLFLQRSFCKPETKNMWRVNTTILFCILFVMVGCIGEEDPLVPLFRRLLDEDEIRIVFIGDSITYGMGLTSAQKNYIDFLKEDLPKLMPEKNRKFLGSLY